MRLESSFSLLVISKQLPWGFGSSRLFQRCITMTSFCIYNLTIPFSTLITIFYVFRKILPKIKMTSLHSSISMTTNSAWNANILVLSGTSSMIPKGCCTLPLAILNFMLVSFTVPFLIFFHKREENKIYTSPKSNSVLCTRFHKATRIIKPLGSFVFLGRDSCCWSRVIKGFEESKSKCLMQGWSCCCV